MQFERPNEFLGNRVPNQRRSWKPKTNMDTSQLPSMFAASLSSVPKRKSTTSQVIVRPEQPKTEVTVDILIPSMFQSSIKTSKEVNESKIKASASIPNPTKQLTLIGEPNKNMHDVVPFIAKSSTPAISKVPSNAKKPVISARSTISVPSSSAIINTRSSSNKAKCTTALKNAPEIESDMERRNQLLCDARKLEEASRKAEAARKIAEEAARKEEDREKINIKKEEGKNRQLQESQRKNENVRRKAERRARLEEEEKATWRKEEAIRRAEEARQRARAEEAECRAREDRTRRSIFNHFPMKVNEKNTRERSPLNLPDQLPDIIDGDSVLRMLNMVNKKAQDDLASISSVDTTSTCQSDLTGWNKTMQEKIKNFLGSSHALPDNYDDSDSDSSDSKCDSDSDEEY